MNRKEKFAELKLKYIESKQKSKQSELKPSELKQSESKQSELKQSTSLSELKPSKLKQSIRRELVKKHNEPRQMPSVDISPTADLLSPILHHDITIGRYGPHVSIKNGFLSAIQSVHSYNFNCCQIFTQSPYSLIVENDQNDLNDRNNRNDQKNMNDINDMNNCKIFAQENDIEIWIHCAYVINLCRVINQPNVNKIHKTVINDMKNALLLGAKGCVVHVGKLCAIENKKLSCSIEETNDKIVLTRSHDTKIKEAIINIKYNIEKILTEFLHEISIMYSIETIQVPWLLIETAAGQGTEYPITIQELRDVWLAIDEKYRKYIGFCIDTCHVFASTLCDLRFPSGTDEFVEQWNELIGWEHVKLIHWNDSLHDFGSKKDRHAKPGSGYIGIDGMNYFKRFATITGKPIITEWKEIEDLEEKTASSSKKINKKNEIIVNVKNSMFIEKS